MITYIRSQQHKIFKQQAIKTIRTTKYRLGMISNINLLAGLELTDAVTSFDFASHRHVHET